MNGLMVVSIIASLRDAGNGGWRLSVGFTHGYRRGVPTALRGLGGYLQNRGSRFVWERLFETIAETIGSIMSFHIKWTFSVLK